MKCPKCDKSFETEQGLGLHNYRSHTDGGKNWGSKGHTFSTKSSTQSATATPPSETRKYLYQVLANQQEIKVKDIIQGMKNIGQARSGSYISHLLARDANIIKIRPGTYKLKKNKTTQSDSVTTLESHQKEIAVSKETLLLRVEHLETQLNAIKKAHLALVSDVL